MKNGDWSSDIMKKPDLQMRSVWSIATPKPREKLHGKHPTQKPVELLRRVILASTAPGASILDPFAGSSTTGIAAALIGDRQFTGIEREQKYIDLSIKRHRDFSPRVNRMERRGSPCCMKTGGFGGGNTRTGLNFETERDLLTAIAHAPGYTVAGSVIYYRGSEVARATRRTRSTECWPSVGLITANIFRRNFFPTMRFTLSSTIRCS